MGFSAEGLQAMVGRMEPVDVDAGVSLVDNQLGL